MSKIIKITAFFLFFVMCIFVKNIYAVESPCYSSPNGTKYVYKGNSCYVYQCYMGAVKWLAPGAAPSNCAGECVPGSTQSKYEAKDCSYTSKTRKCCSTGLSSEWGEWVDGESGADCPAINNCASNECWNGAFCEKSNSNYNSSCKKTCSYGSGWTFTRPGSWSGSYDWEYFYPGGSSYSISSSSGGCLGTINSTNCNLIKGKGVDYLRTGGTSTFCKNQGASFYALENPYCEGGNQNGGSGYPDGMSSNGKQTYNCSKFGWTAKLRFTRGNVTCTKTADEAC